MKTVGIIGGIGPESTVEYYRGLITGYQSRVQDGSYPSILINSIDMAKMLRLIEVGDLDATTEYLAGEVVKVARAGGDFAVLASNTPHIVFEAVRRLSPIPMISIVEAACEAALGLNLKRVGLFGTRFTMQGRFYPSVFSDRSVVVVSPEPEEQAYIHDKYMGELVKGLIVPDTRNRLLAIADRLRQQQQVEGIVLGGTELPPVLRGATLPGLSFLDTTRIHVEKILAEMLS